MANLRTDQDYLDAGVEPPEHIPHGLSGDDNGAVISIINAAGKHTHKWTQRGNEIDCVAGHNPHGHRINPNQLLIGTSPEGAPLFKILDFPAPVSENGINVPPDVSNEG